MMTIVSAPADLVVAESDGIAVRFAGVELTRKRPNHVAAVQGEPGIRVNLEGVRSHETVGRDQSFVEARLRWVERRKEHGAETAGDGPIMPGVLALEPIRVVISDDAGTEYHSASGRVAGDGTEWAASWSFVPEPPKNVRTLSLDFTLHGESTGKRCRVELV
jgi:hypothetical protein